MSKTRLAGIVVLILALGWVGYYVWCSSRHEFPSGVKQGAAGFSVSTEKDCASVLRVEPSVQLQSNELTVRLVDQTSRRDVEHLSILARPACLSLYGARQAATVAGEDTSWFNGLTFFLVDAIDGATDQAQFVRDIISPWSTGKSRYVVVASGTFAAYTKDELIWTLGHELGHGVYDDSMKRKPIIPVAAILIFVGFYRASLRTAGRPWRILGIVLILSGVAFLLSGHALFSKAHEMDADVFGVDAAAHTGVGKALAKAAALSVLHAHPMEEERWYRCGGLNLNVHPSTEKRIKHIENF